MVKVMKKMKKSTIARGVFARSQVWKGLKVKTSAGLKKSDLFKNKWGRIVSKHASKVATVNVLKKAK
ncbi:unnamed protein product [Amoebophrya sp. A25]|nr:unnamed protein product [Amoebophrya sp. A25]|eukprot:GSA25T00001722001.1